MLGGNYWWCCCRCGILEPHLSHRPGKKQDSNTVGDRNVLEFICERVKDRRYERVVPRFGDYASKGWDI